MNERQPIEHLLRSDKWSTGVTLNEYADEAALEIERLREKLAEVERYARTLEKTIAELARQIDERR